MKKHHALIVGLIPTIALAGIIITKKTIHADLTSLDPAIPIITEDETVTMMQEIDETDVTSTITMVEPDKNIPPDALIDSDYDGLSDDIEKKLGTDPFKDDTDGDGYKDGEEIDHGYNPLDPKPDRSSLQRFMEVDLTKQKMYYVANGTIVKTFPISSGLIGRETPRGTFKIIRKMPVADYRGPGYYLPGVKWNMEFKSRYFIHGTYWHDKFGIQPMSHGCVNVSTADAEKIYTFLQTGDSVIIAGKTPRGKVEG
jgi:hypothetical protein